MATTDIATFASGDLGELSRMAKEDNKGALNESGPKIPVLKINYDEKSIFPRGKWVLGQVKDKDGTITEQGREAYGFIALAVRSRYNFYNEMDKTQNCCSPMFLGREQVRGSKLGLVCGRDCPKRAKDINPRCSAQKVVFGLALVKDDKGAMETVECRMYIKGKSYMPFCDYLDDAVRYEHEGRAYELPIYAFVTKLSSVPEKKYFIAQFQRGQIFSMAQIKQFGSLVPKVNALIEELNSKQHDDDEEKHEAAPKMKPAESVSPRSTIDVTPTAKATKVEPIADEIPSVRAASSKMDDLPADYGVSSTPPAESMDFDIESAIASALAETRAEAAK